MKILTFITTVCLALVFIVGTGANNKSKSKNSFKTPASTVQQPPVVNDTNLRMVKSENTHLSFSAGFDNNFYVVDETDQAYLYLEAKAGNYTPENKSRSPLNISIVIDRSGSMHGDKLAYVKTAAKFVVDQLTQNDKLSIVMYDDVVDVLHVSANVTNKEEIKRKIDGIADKGSTNLGGGMVEGYKQVQKTYDKEYINRVFLLSDGMANVGVTNPQALQKIARDYCSEYGISISTFGVGLDFNEDLMTSISESGCGNYYFIKDPEFVPSIFEKELNGILNAVAQDTWLNVEIPVGLSIDKVFGYKYELKGNMLSVNFHDVFANETKAVLLRFNILDNTLGNQEIKATLKYNDAVGQNKQSMALNLLNTLMATENQKEFATGVVPKVKEQVVLFISNDMLEQAMREVDNGNYDKARAITAENESYLMSNDAYVKRSEELKVQSSNNAVYKSKIVNAEQMSDTEKKEVQKSGKSANYKAKYKKVK